MLPPQLPFDQLFELGPSVLPSGSHSLVRLPSQTPFLIRHLVRPAMPVSLGDDYYPYSPRPFVMASAAIALPTAGPVLAPTAPPVPVVASVSAPGKAPGPAPASSPTPALASASAPAPAPGPAAASNPAHTPTPAPVVPPVPVGVSAPVPVVAASSAAVGAASAMPLVAPAMALSAAAVVDPAYQPPPPTSAGLSSAEVQSARVSPPVAPAPLPAAATALPPTVQAGPAPAPSALVPLAQRPPSPGRRQHRPHSPVPCNEREMSRRRHDSPRRRGSQANRAAPRGGQGGWWGGRGRSGGWVYDQPVKMADLQRVVSNAMREERNGRASLSNLPRVAPAPVSLPPAAPYAPAPPPPSSAAPPPCAAVASVAAPGNRLRLPWVPPMAGMEFVTAGAGPVTPQYPSLLPMAPDPPAADLPIQSLVGPSPSADVPEASLGQLWRLSEGLRAVHLIQVYCHAALSRGVPLVGSPLDECSDAADRLAELLAPVLAAPARSGVAGVGQLGTALRGLRRVMRAATAVDLIDATTVVVRELHRSMTGLLAVLDADQM
ncbi:unnamed protein product [Closterium sp. Naga37s-1]|nr:unnamed protein product [Closterium sp. Naga37s-1]CAI5529787.1 unnamed protein product [Closterium sp. Naga37s-1]